MGGVHCNVCRSKSTIQKLGFLCDSIATNDEPLLLLRTNGLKQSYILIHLSVCLFVMGSGEVPRPVWPTHHAMCTPIWPVERTYKAKRGGRARALLKLQNSNVSRNCPFCLIYSTIGIHHVMKGYWPIIKISSRH
jgi:hypothetical protein